MRPSFLSGNRFGRSEWAGAFGDLGTLIPFVVAYVSLLGIDACGLLFTFGITMLASGLYYRTPFPVQPMKAIGTAATLQATQGFVVTPSAVHAAGLVTGLFWLLLGLTGMAERLVRWVPKSLVVGIVLGLGLKFMVDGLAMMAEQWWLAGGSLALALILLDSRRLPAMFVLLGIGALVSYPELSAQLGQLHPALHLPSWHLDGVSFRDLVGGAVFLALPQIPLTLGNAIIAISDENNRLFPDRPVSVRQVAVSTGLMNLWTPAFGGVPLCHGAGGMAGHVRFGARTGGALVILGVILLGLALFFSESIIALLAAFPKSVLGVILFLAGAQLALGVGSLGDDKSRRFLVLTTAAFSLWNVGIAFIAGVLLHVLLQRGWVKP
jgi:predicted benzoate:H+ symporter BenE